MYFQRHYLLGEAAHCAFDVDYIGIGLTDSSVSNSGIDIRHIAVLSPIYIN